MASRPFAKNEVEKRCPRCEQVKPREGFGKHKSRRDGLQPICKPCGSAATKASSAKKPGAYLAAGRAYQAAHREQYREHSRRWHAENPEYRKEWDAAHPGDAVKRTRKWQNENMPRVLAGNATYRAAVAAQTIPLSKDQKEEIVSFYVERDRLTRETGIPHHVDHIVPLKGRQVRGLHVPWNLQVLPARVNISKGNKLIAEAA